MDFSSKSDGGFGFLQGLLDSLQISLWNVAMKNTDENRCNSSKNGSTPDLPEDADEYETLLAVIESEPRGATGREIHSPFLRLCQATGLNGPEREILLLAISLYFRPALSSYYSFFHDGEHAAPSLEVLDALHSSNWERKAKFRIALRPDSPLRRFCLIKDSFRDLPAGTPLPLVPEERILHYLSGEECSPMVSPLYERLLFPAEGMDFLSGEEAEERERERRNLLSLLAERGNDAGNPGPVIHLEANDPAHAKEWLALFAAESGLALLSLHTETLLARGSEEDESVAGELARESRLHGVSFVMDLSAMEETRKRILLAFLRTLLPRLQAPLILVAGKGEALPSLLETQEYRISAPELCYSERLALWKHLFLDSHDKQDSCPIRCERYSPEHLASRFRFGYFRILSAYRTARSQALLRNPGKPVITDGDLLRGCTNQTGHRLRSLARRVEMKFGWEALILPEEQRETLREIIIQERHRELVYGSWGFEGKGYGRGLHLLFFGKPGTGKTMAAAVLARELDRELYRIDLSTVVSKYIGETEKNLSRIFAEGERSHAILFFDEADSLFGKRSEVRDAKDRYANMEVGYLLQKMEEYPGMTILASNLAENMDPAFTRRIHFFLEFPLPEGEIALNLWQLSFPDDAPLADDLDFPFLAKKTQLSGGEIRNVALASAFSAAEEGSSIGMRHVMRAVRSMYRKTSRIYNEGDLKPYYDLGFTPLPESGKKV